MAVQPGQSSTPQPIPTVSDTADDSKPPVEHFANVIVRYSLTQATDTSNIRLVFAAVKETILNNALKDSGIL